ncbi:DUF1493 family protein [Enterobacillus tribolii]
MSYSLNTPLLYDVLKRKSPPVVPDLTVRMLVESAKADCRLFGLP